jgi:serine/threonine protein kinase/tetratricopeptide (TPR) repeat protein
MICPSGSALSVRSCALFAATELDERFEGQGCHTPTGVARDAGLRLTSGDIWYLFAPGRSTAVSAVLSRHDSTIADDPVIAARYELGERIASGGFATIFRAIQNATGQIVAIKVLRLERSADAPPIEDQIDRFRRETRLCAELHHPNIVPLIDSGETEDGQVYAVFAFVPGWNLGDLLAAEGALDPAEALHLMTQVIDAVSSAHEKGVVHRDLKPGNIMISSTGARRNALVLDFGLGTVAADPQLWNLRRLTQRGEYLGTPCYSAPEQLRNEPPTVRSDLYAWGLIYLECLTGEPVMGTTPHEIIHGHLSPEPVPIPRALMDRELGRVLRLVTEKDVRKRTISAAEVLAAMQRCAREEPPSRRTLAAEPRHLAAKTSNDSQPATRISGPIWMVPLGRNPNFSGREDLLCKISDVLDASRPLAVMALYGLGGVGKTQLALEYAYRNADRYRMVAWVHAEQPESLEADYCAIGVALGLPETPDRRRKIEAVRSWLERNDRWLLVFDNATNPEVLRSHLPRSHSGHIIVTSRRTSWRSLAACLEVGILDPGEAVDFLLRRTGEEDRAGAAELSDELGCLPLALEEAAAYMEATGRSISNYLPLLRDQRQRVLLEGLPATDRAGGLRTTWELSFQRVEGESPEASELLDLCAFLAPDDIPLEVFRQGVEHLPEKLRKSVADEMSFDACVAALRRYSLVHTEPGCLSVHRLVQLASRGRMTERQRGLWTASALRVVEAAYPHGTLAGAYQEESGRLLPHALATLFHAAPYATCSETAGRLLQRTGLYRSVRGDFDGACAHMERALRLFEGGSPPDEDQIAVLLWELGMVRYALGELDAAREHIERSAGIFERIKGATNPWVAQSLLALSWVLRTLGESEETLSTAERSLRMLQASLGADHPITSMSQSVMARALWNLNRIPEARQCAERALAVLGAERDALHPLMVGTWNNLAQVLLDLGDLERASDCADRGLEIENSAWGADHPFHCITLSLRGTILRQRGDLEGARLALEGALAGAQRSMSHLHEDIAISRSELGNVFRLLGDFERSRRTLEHALAGSSRVCGNRARSESHARVAFALLLRELGDLAAARDECETGLRVAQARFGVGHPLRVAGLNALGWVLRDLGEPEQAARRFAEAMSIGEATGLTDHFEYAESIEGARACRDA